MTRIPTALRKKLAANPFYRNCARRGLHGHECSGRITWEHAIIHAGKQVQAEWAIIPLCEKAHSVGAYQDGGDLSKPINEWIALNRATNAELLAISQALDYFRVRANHNTAFGMYLPDVPEYTGIDYGRVRDRISPLAYS